MSERTTVSFRCSEGLSELLSEVADETGVSKSALIRETLSKRLDAEELDDMDIPEHLIIEAQRERIKRENRVDDLRGGFEGRVLDQFERRFARDYRADDMREIASGYVSEARLLFDGEREAEAVDYVNRLMERFEEMREQDDSEGLDPSEAFAQVEQDPEEETGTEVDSQVLAEMTQQAQERIRGTAADRSDPDMARALAKEHGVPESDALTAVKRARRAESGTAGVSLDD
jgi:predicted DNA-binding protein